MLTLRPYQEEAIQAVTNGIQRPLVALPTGTGKTVVFVHLVDRRGGRALILVHRDELIQQALEKLQLVNPDLDIGVVKAAQNAVDAQVVVASVQTISREKRLAQLAVDINTVIVDEAHHAVAPSYRRVLEHVGSLFVGGPLTVGFTATPERADNTGLGDIWQGIAYQRSILEMMLAGYLCDLRAVQVRLKLDLDDVHTRHGDFIESELGDAMTEANAPTHVVAAYQEHAAGRKALVFTPTVRLAHDMACAFQGQGINAEAVDGTTPEDERRATLRRLHTGETMVVCNCLVLTEGFDSPSVNCIVVARPTKSKPLYIQMIGRGTRIYPGKDDLLVLDVVGASSRHSLMTATSLFQTRLENKSVLEAEEERRERAARRAEPIAYGDRVATEANLFRARPMHWVRTRRGRWALSLGNQAHLRLVPSRSEDDKWVVVHVANKQKRQIYAGLPLDYALGAGEDYAREHGVWSLFAESAGWRRSSAPPTPGQLDFLRKWGSKSVFPPGLTKGAAADLMTSIIGDWD
jgi:ATP-dependent helicase IRC3